MNLSLEHPEGGVNLLEYAKVVWKQKWMMTIVVVTATFLSAVYAVMLPNIYRAEATIMPVAGGKGGGLASVMPQLGQLASIVGVSTGSQSATQQLLAILQSRTLIEEVIRKHNLMPVLLRGSMNDDGLAADDSGGAARRAENAFKALRSHMKILDDPTIGVISIAAFDEDPQFAADLANWYVESLKEVINNNAFTSAKRNRLFVERRLAQNQEELLEAGKQLNEFYKGGRVSSVESSVDVPIHVGMRMEGSDAGGATALDGVGEQQANLESLEWKKALIDDALKKVDATGTTTDASPSAGTTGQKRVVEDIPQQVYLQYLTLRRNILQQMNGMLTQQYEMAKIEEAKDELAFQVIDPGRVPAVRFKPNRRQIVVLSFLASFFLAVFAAFSVEHYQSVRRRFACRD